MMEATKGAGCPCLPVKKVAIQLGTGCVPCAAPAVLEEELDAFLFRVKYAWGQGEVKGYRRDRQERQLTSTLATEAVSVPRSRLQGGSGHSSEWRCQALRAYKMLEALIPSAYLAGTNTRRVKKSLFVLFQGAVSKDVVAVLAQSQGGLGSMAPSQPDGGGHRASVLDGTVVKPRLDREATAISVLVALGVQWDGQKVLLAVQHMAGESTAAWRQFLEKLDARGLPQPTLVSIDGAPGLEAAVAPSGEKGSPIQRCTLHKHRNLLAHAPKRLQKELNGDYRDMIYAPSATGRQERRKAFCANGARNAAWGLPSSDYES